MRVRAVNGLVAFEVADDSALALAIKEREIRASFAEHFSFVSAEETERMVAFEMSGIANAARVDRSRWCTCADQSAASYYRTDTSHGFFHDPVAGGCGAITQAG